MGQFQEGVLLLEDGTVYKGRAFEPEPTKLAKWF